MIEVTRNDAISACYNFGLTEEETQKFVGTVFCNHNNINISDPIPYHKGDRPIPFYIELLEKMYIYDRHFNIT